MRGTVRNHEASRTRRRKRGYVDILWSGRRGPGTMNGGDFCALSRIGDCCAAGPVCFKVSVDSLFGIFPPDQTSVSSIKSRKPERRRADGATLQRRRDLSSSGDIQEVFRQHTLIGTI